jgi:L-threonylcarbamoyladenylate synthase
VPDFITSGSGTVGLRIPNHPVTLSLLNLLGEPLAVTSANRSGFPSPLTAQEVLDQLAGRIDAVVDGGQCPGGIPSTVLSLATDPPTVLRAGPIGVPELSQALQKGGFELRVAT